MILKRAIINEKFSSYFSRIEIFPLSFLYMAKHKIRSPIILEKLFFLDKLLLPKFPFLKEMCGESVVILENKI